MWFLQPSNISRLPFPLALCCRLHAPPLLNICKFTPALASASARPGISFSRSPWHQQQHQYQPPLGTKLHLSLPNLTLFRPKITRNSKFVKNENICTQCLRNIASENQEVLVAIEAEGRCHLCTRFRSRATPSQTESSSKFPQQAELKREQLSSSRAPADLKPISGSC